MQVRELCEGASGGRKCRAATASRPARTGDLPLCAPSLVRANPF